MARANPAKPFWLAGPTTFWLSMVQACGRDAALEGVPLKANPHTYAVERDHWETGHRRGRAELEMR